MSVNKDEILLNEVTESSEVAEGGEEAAKKTLGFGFWLSVVWLFVISMLALLAPVLPLKDPGENFVQYEEQENPLTKKSTVSTIIFPKKEIYNSVIEKLLVDYSINFQGDNNDEC